MNDATCPPPSKIRMLKILSRFSPSIYGLFFGYCCLLFAMLFLPAKPENIYPMVLFYLLLSGFFFLLAQKIPTLSLAPKSFWLIVILSCGVRIFFILKPPLFSNDIYRYYADGYSLSHGLNPYRIAPNHPDNRSLQNEIWFKNIGHPSLPTIYPPLAEGLFTLAYWSIQSPAGLKILFALFEGILIWTIYQLLHYLNYRRELLLLYLLHPLAIIETHFSGHLDVMGIACMMLALYWLKQGRNFRCMVALGAAFLIKFIPVLLLPHFYRGLTKKSLMLVFPLLIAVVYGACWGVGKNCWGSLPNYIEDWEFGSFLFSPLRLILSKPVAKLICGGIFIVGQVIILRQTTALIKKCSASLALFLLMLPTVYPWYLLWVIAFLPFHRNPVVLVWSCTISVTNIILIDYIRDGIWHESWVIYGFEYLPLWGIIGYAWAQQTNIKRKNAHASKS